MSKHFVHKISNLKCLSCRAGHNKGSIPEGPADARHDGTAEEPAEAVIASDTVKQVALGIGEDVIAPLPEQAQRSPSSLEFLNISFCFTLMQSFFRTKKGFPAKKPEV